MVDGNIIFNNYWEMLMKKNNEIIDLKKYKVVIDYLREKLMHSNIPIEYVNEIMSIVNFAEDERCISSLFYDEKYINKDLRRILEVI